MKRLRKLALILGALGLLLGVWAFGAEPAYLRVREVPLEIPGWPAGRNGTRIAILADLHVGSPYNGLGKLREVVRRTNDARPDLILIAGDLVIDDVVGGRWVSPEALAPELGRLRAPLGVYAVLGNHDWWLDAPRVQRALEGVRIPVLEDRSIRIDRGGPPFWLAGISDFWEGPHDVRKALAGVKDAAPVIAFTHNPDIFPAAPDRVMPYWIIKTSTCWWRTTAGEA